MSEIFIVKIPLFFAFYKIGEFSIHTKLFYYANSKEYSSKLIPKMGYGLAKIRFLANLQM